MIVTANCNISKIINNVISNKRFGITCESEDKKMILQHYMDSLDCDTEKIICIKDYPCEETYETSKCNLLVEGIAYKDTLSNNRDPNLITFSVGNIINGSPPYSYQWSFDSNLFDINSGDDTSSTLKLKWKNGVTQDISTDITIECIDSDGCSYTETCTYSLETGPSNYYGQTYYSAMGCL